MNVCVYVCMSIAYDCKMFIACLAAAFKIINVNLKIIFSEIYDFNGNFDVDFGFEIQLRLTSLSSSSNGGI